jgi:hypothetical protein
MAYVSEPLFNLARTARHMAVLMGSLGVVGILVIIAGDKSQGRVTDLIKMFLVTSVIPASLIFMLSFAIDRGKTWAGPMMVLVCIGQVPGMVFCGGCLAVMPSAYLLARCMIAWPEMMFQIRAARRNRADRRRGFEPVPAAAPTSAVGNASPGGPMPVQKRQAVLLVPKSLKPSARSQTPDLSDVANSLKEPIPPTTAARPPLQP